MGAIDSGHSDPTKRTKKPENTGLSAMLGALILQPIDSAIG